MVARCPAGPGSNPASSQPTADCQPSGGLPPGMALGCGLTSVSGDRGENYEKCQKTFKEKNVASSHGQVCVLSSRHRQAYYQEA
jgi:hypothetical protein